MELSLLNQDSTPQYICLKMCIYVFLKTEKYNFVCKICLKMFIYVFLKTIFNKIVQFCF